MVSGCEGPSAPYASIVVRGALDLSENGVGGLGEALLDGLWTPRPLAASLFRRPRSLQGRGPRKWGKPPHPSYDVRKTAYPLEMQA